MTQAPNFIAVSATSGGHVVTPTSGLDFDMAIKCTAVVELRAWDRQTDGRTDGSQHRLIRPTVGGRGLNDGRFTNCGG